MRRSGAPALCRAPELELRWLTGLEGYRAGRGPECHLLQKDQELVVAASLAGAYWGRLGRVGRNRWAAGVGSEILVRFGEILRVEEIG